MNCIVMQRCVRVFMWCVCVCMDVCDAVCLLMNNKMFGSFKIKGVDEMCMHVCIYMCMEYHLFLY